MPIDAGVSSVRRPLFQTFWLTAIDNVYVHNSFFKLIKF